MIYPSNIESKIGFDQIKEMLRAECLSTLGQAYIDKIKFSFDYNLINKLVHQTAEFKALLESKVLFPSQNYVDVTVHLNHISIPGAFLDPESFLSIKLSLKTISRCLEFFDQSELYPYLKDLKEGVALDYRMYNRIEATVDDHGKVKDNASDDLFSIRQKLLQAQLSARREVDRILRHVKKEGYAVDDVEITIRGGRLVIPVLAEHKRRVKGFIHDESATGQTVFIEPAEVLEINNLIKELEHEEKRELIKILSQLTDYLRPYIPELEKAYKFLGLIDFIRSKAKLSILLEAVKPEFVNKQILHWREARHPLLYINLKKQNKTIVPLNVDLDEAQRILVISGPNAGGKSVCLKTVGLVQYMFQCGLLVPVSEGSIMGLYQDLFLDIGDEQSIENDLSTYSSHLKNMKYFLSFSGKKTLVLIDEFGTGTEPQFGAAIAESVLEKLNEIKVYGIVTTHYANLKSFADKSEGLVNAAMRFDMEKLEPLYQLETGRPGSSFALEIAQKIGLPQEIIDSSKEKLGSLHVDFENLVRDLEKEKTILSNTNKQIAEKEKDLSKTLEEYASLKEYIESNKKKLLNEAKEQSKQLIKDANQKIEKTIREIKENNAEKDITKNLREELEGFKENLQHEPVEDKRETHIESGEIEPGDFVRVRESGAIGEVISIKGKDIEILIGELKSNVKLSRLEKLSRKDYRKEVKKNSGHGHNMDLLEKKMNFYPDIDVRGKRGEEALYEVDSLLDSAILFGVNELKIVHGKGDGILRILIRNHLKNYKEVASMTDEHADRGGAGVTIVKLK